MPRLLELIGAEQVDAAVVLDQVAEEDVHERAGLVAEDDALQRRVDGDARLHALGELDLRTPLGGGVVVLGHVGDVGERHRARALAVVDRRVPDADLGLRGLDRDVGRVVDRLAGVRRVLEHRHDEAVAVREHDVALPPPGEPRLRLVQRQLADRAREQPLLALDVVARGVDVHEVVVRPQLLLLVIRRLGGAVDRLLPALRVVARVLEDAVGVLRIDDALEPGGVARPQRGVLDRRALEEVAQRGLPVALVLGHELLDLDVVEAPGVVGRVDVVLDERVLDDRLVWRRLRLVAQPDHRLEDDDHDQPGQERPDQGAPAHHAPVAHLVRRSDGPAELPQPHREHDHADDQHDRLEHERVLVRPDPGDVQVRRAVRDRAVGVVLPQERVDPQPVVDGEEHAGCDERAGGEGRRQLRDETGGAAHPGRAGALVPRDPRARNPGYQRHERDVGQLVGGHHDRRVLEDVEAEVVVVDRIGLVERLGVEEGEIGQVVAGVTDPQHEPDQQPQLRPPPPRHAVEAESHGHDHRERPEHEGDREQDRPGLEVGPEDALEAEALEEPVLHQQVRELVEQEEHEQDGGEPERARPQPATRRRPRELDRRQADEPDPGIRWAWSLDGRHQACSAGRL